MIEEMTDEERQLLKEAIASYGSPQVEEKHNVHTFLNNVANSSDTTKTGNLTETEIGFTPYSLRTYKQLEVVADVLCKDDLWQGYFKKKGEILTATSLSKDAKLITLAVIQRRELSDISKHRVTSNKGWFKSKPVEESQS
jgi:hypothetical protein